MVLRGLRDQTMDIDFYYAVAPENDGKLASAVQELKVKLDMYLEYSDPGHYVPLPPGREGRLSYHDRFEELDVYLDDPYAMAVSKLNRGKERDLLDIGLLAAAGLIALDALEEMVCALAVPTSASALRFDLTKMLGRIGHVRSRMHPPSTDGTSTRPPAAP